QQRFMVPPSTGFSYELISNPYMTGQETTMGWTRTQRDVEGRVVEVNHFSGSELPAPWGVNSASTGAATITYNANDTKADDEAQVSRTSHLDGLGRLDQVTENGIMVNGS